MLDRLNVAPVFRGQWKGLTQGGTRDRDHPSADWAARIVLYGAPVVVFLVVLLRGGQLRAPEALLTGVAILTGGLLTVFGALATYRLRLGEVETYDPGSANDRDGLDESVAHLLSAALACVIDAVVLVVGLNLSPDDATSITGIPAAIAAGVSTYVALIFVIAIQRLYTAYTVISRVPDHLNGFARRGRIR